MSGYIKVQGAREHNLKNVNITVPKDKLVVLRAFRVPVNHQWRLILFMQKVNVAMLKLSSYARQFLGVLGKPDADFIEGLSPLNFY